ncbi:chromatin-remodeling complex subunit ies6 [Malassezia yamatoensis]|uniref:Chromatin-remodeling complex subunit ies6 n=1 Tax=Malassezia yamatoensis TaxID=253288 RepID=A0AAJ5YRL7_9BASI|nr:chromatin-remodeling complex subunit ies6 [Malassezia yamatoensis]
MSDSGPTIEDLSVSEAPRPFKTIALKEKPNSSVRKNKSLKQILNNERDAHLQRLGLDKKRPDAKRRKAEEVGAHAEAIENSAGIGTTERRIVPTYISVEAPPSLLPAKRYCDITGLQARYTDPKTRLRYHSAEIYDTIKGFAPGVDNSYLALRGSASQLM